MRMSESSLKNSFAPILQGSTNLEHIQIIKKSGGRLEDSYLDEGFILDKRIGVNQPKRIENAKILIANTRSYSDDLDVLVASILLTYFVSSHFE